MRLSLTTSTLMLAAAATCAQTAPQAPSDRFPASRPIEGQYIVVFKPATANPGALAAELAKAHGGQLLHSYSHSLKGFAARLPQPAVDALRRNPNVGLVEQDATVSLNEQAMVPPSVQSAATWGLDRIDQRSATLDASYRYQYSGAGVHAFVIDTGVLAEHLDFGGRVASGYSVIADGRGTSDCNGHGTHVAGTLGSQPWGVAKGVALVPVRVLDCSGAGSNSGVIAGIDWVAGQTGRRPAVANLSLGGSFSSAVNSSVAAAVAKGVTMVVAAGNSGADACSASPASEPSALTVAATEASDARASYSNYGKCVDLFAPGSSVTSSWITSTDASATLSGTSMASPHVAGVVALALAANASATPATVADFLLANATANLVTGAGTDSPNKLIYSMAAGMPASAPAKTLALGAMSGKGVKSGKNWAATVTVTIKQHDGTSLQTGVAGVNVSGSFSFGGNASCLTGSTGSCTLRSAGIPTSNTQTRFDLGQVTGAGLTYDASRNAVPSYLYVNRP